MTPKQLVRYFGTVRNASEQTGIPNGTIRQWINRKKIPKLRQYEIAHYYPDLKVGRK